MSEQLFHTFYNQLTPSQKEAVDTIEGPVMVIAGPGTGKTQILAMRIANILRKTQINPSNILALTFTESGVTAMKKRLAEIIGPQGYYVNVYTFHSFCNEIIQQFPEKFIVSKDLQPLNDLDRIQLFENLIDKLPLKELKTISKNYFYLKSIIRSIQDLKREGITVSEFKRVLSDQKTELDEMEKINPRTNKPYVKYLEKEKKLAKNNELLLIYENYQKKLKEQGRYDFEDMIMLVSKMLETDNDLLAYYQEKYQYIHVDEFQDSNNAQNKIVTLLTSFFDQPNIFVVGDDDQCIYRFQGASLENLLFFNKQFPSFKTIVIDENFRSTQLILNSAQDVIRNNVTRIGNYLNEISKDLKSRTNFEEKKITYYEFSTEDYENFFVTQKIQELTQRGVPYSEIAVLYRDNADSLSLAEMLTKASIPFNNHSGSNILTDNYISRFIDLLKAISTPNDNLNFFRVLNYEVFEIMQHDLFMLSKIRYYKKSNYVDLVTDINFLKDSLGSKFSNIIPIHNFSVNYLKWQQDKENLTLSKFIEKIFKDAKFLDFILNLPDKIQILQKFKTLFNYIKQVNNIKHNLTLNDFLKDIDSLIEHGIQITEEELLLSKDAVQLMTVHKSKGLEFSYLFIIKCYDGKFGNKITRDLIKLPESLFKNFDLTHKERNEDERRLFYVALTRAKEKIFLSHAKKYPTYNGINREVSPSQFILEIDKKYISKNNPEKYESMKSDLLEIMFKDPSPDIYLDDEKAFLTNLTEKYVMNVTALDTYLECPRKFKYNNLLRIPRMKSPILSFGSAVHFALQYFFLRYKEKGEMPSISEFLSLFTDGLQHEILTESELNDLKNRGIQILTEYFNFYRDSFKKPAALEFDFVKHRVYLDDIPLTGKIDKIEILDDSSKTVKVIDYKTGQPKTRNQIEGKTKSSLGKNLKRQLVFYKLLGDLDKFFPYKIERGEFDFVQSKDGKFKKESFEITDGETEELKSEIKTVCKKIRNLEFSKTEDKKTCQNCDYNKICWG